MAAAVAFRSGVIAVRHHGKVLGLNNLVRLPGMGDDAELEAIRQRRMAEMMAGAQGKGPLSPEDQAKQAEAKEAAEEQRAAMLVALLHPAARVRLARIAMVKPDKARGVEDMIIAAARRGALAEKLTEERLIELLEQVNERTQAKTKVTIQRRRAFDDDF